MGIINISSPILSFATPDVPQVGFGVNLAKIQHLDSPIKDRWIYWYTDVY